MTSIYGLVCPIKRKIVYVGKTNGTIEERLKRHISKPHGKLKEWMDSLQEHPVAVLLERDANIDSEKNWILEFGMENLLNSVLTDPIDSEMLEGTLIFHYKPLNRDYLFHTKNPYVLKHSLRYRLKKGTAPKCLQEDYNKSLKHGDPLEKFDVSVSPLPLEMVAEDRPNPIYKKRSWQLAIKKALQKGLKENDVLDWLETQGY